MTTPDILYKLGKELNTGIASEAQVVYLLAGVRKLIERDDLQDRYADLKFHCDWVLHPKLEGTGAKKVLREFDAAHPHLKADIDIHDLPNGLGKKIIRLSSMKSFETELESFLHEYGLPSLTHSRPDGWAHFLLLYTKVIEDIPLQVALPAQKKKGQQPPAIPSPKHISGVTVHFREAVAPLEERDGEAEILYEVRWTIQDKNGRNGSVFVLNSYTRPVR
jgi:hypothetical protein